MNMIGEMEQNQLTQETPILYYSKFDLLGPLDVVTLCNYRAFIEKIIIRLGEDWRFESNLLAEEIVNLRKVDDMQDDLTQFNIFNQFLEAFLKGKLGKQFEMTSITESAQQEYFTQELISKFHEDSIHSSITFKTLTIGYFVIGTEIWNQVFRNPPPPYKKITKINAFATRYEIKREKTRSLDSASLEVSSVRRRISKFDLLSFSEFDNNSQKIETERMTSARWAPPRLELFTKKELRQIEATIKIIDHTASRTEILSYFVCFIDEIRTKSKQKARIFSLSNEFYLTSFIIWIIFNVKTFFEMSFRDYLCHVKALMQDQWREEYERPLKKFQIVLEREWIKLLKDYTIDLHDDEQILKLLIERMQKEIQKDWEDKLSFLEQSFSDL